MKGKWWVLIVGLLLISVGIAYWVGEPGGLLSPGFLPPAGEIELDCSATPESAMACSGEVYCERIERPPFVQYWACDAYDKIIRLDSPGDSCPTDLDGNPCFDKIVVSDGNSCSAAQAYLFKIALPRCGMDVPARVRDRCFDTGEIQLDLDNEDLCCTATKYRLCGMIVDE